MGDRQSNLITPQPYLIGILVRHNTGHLGGSWEVWHEAFRVEAKLLRWGQREVVLEGCGACNGTPLLIVRQVQDPRKVSSEEDLERAWLRGF